MSDVAFVLVGLAALFGLGVPLLTVGAKILLLLRRRRSVGITDFGSALHYLLIVGPVALPALWVVSAGLHQSEAGWFATGAGARHLAGQACWNALVLGVVVALAIAVAILRTGARIGAARRRQVPGDDGRQLTARLDRICAGHPVLARLRRRIVVVHQPEHSSCTVGLLRPIIEIDAELVGQLDDRALEGALLHEAEHVRGFDPLRYLLASVALSLNPLGRLLAPELGRWRWSREARCDRAAVGRGAAPLSLAHALIVAARGGAPSAAPRAALSQRADGMLLRLRVWLLLDYAQRRIGAPRRVLPALLVATSMVLLTAWLPHAVAAWPLDGLHIFVDATVAQLTQR